MSYSIKAELSSYKRNDGQQAIFIQILYKRKVYKIPTEFKVKAYQYDNGKIIKHPNAKNISLLIQEQINGIETKLIEAFKVSANLALNEVKDILIGSRTATSTLGQFIPVLIEQYKGKVSDATIATYNTLLNDINNYKATINFKDITISWLNYFEAYLRTKLFKKECLNVNTINKKMKTLKTILNRASEHGYIEKKVFEKYKAPKLEHNIPEFITEEEMESLFKFAKLMNRPGHQLAVYYFLLSCYAGFRISDLKKFEYKTMVQNDSIIIRAKKNGTIVSIPVYKKLAEILEVIKEKSLYLSEQKMREYVREVALFVGISRKIKIHTARHSFAMMMVNRGLSLDDVAELLGDSIGIARVYARISNTRLKKEILDKMG